MTHEKSFKILIYVLKLAILEEGGGEANTGRSCKGRSCPNFLSVLKCPKLKNVVSVPETFKEKLIFNFLFPSNTSMYFQKRVSKNEVKVLAAR